MSIKKELIPLNSQKSFYGKAVDIEFPNGQKVLESYGTVVCTIDSQGVDIEWEKVSNTTLKHLKSFLSVHGKKIGTKKEMKKRYGNN